MEVKATMANVDFYVDRLTVLNMQPAERSVTKEGSHSKFHHAHKNNNMPQGGQLD